MKTTIIGMAAVSAVMVTGLRADVKSWRDGGNGLYNGATAPGEWAPAWSTPLESVGNASPILVGSKLFFTAEPAKLICADAESGEILWERSNDYATLAGEKVTVSEAEQAKREAAEKEIASLERDLYRSERRMRRAGSPELEKEIEGLKEKIAELEKEAGIDAAERKPPAHDVNGYASYTPVSDGERAWVCFGLGVVVCYDLEGERIWHKRLDDPDHNWGGASSPTLVDGKLIVRFSDYVALEPATGEELWRAPSAGVVFNSPASFELEGDQFLVTARGELIRAEDGKVLSSQGFEVEAKPWCFFNTPSVVGRMIYGAHGCEGQQGDAWALEIPTDVSTLESDGLKKVWQVEVDQNRYYSSPVVHEGLVYLISREYVFQALDAASGEIMFSEKIRGLNGTAYPSLTLFGDALFIGGEEGNAVVVKAGDTFEEIGRLEIDPFRSTPIYANGKVYLRTQDNLQAVAVD